MPKWTKPSEDIPEVECGDRVLIIVMERPHITAPIRPRLVTLVATERGWDAIEDTYAGYAPHDGVLWTTEADLCRIAEIVAR